MIGARSLFLPTLAALLVAYALIVFPHSTFAQTEDQEGYILSLLKQVQELQAVLADLTPEHTREPSCVITGTLSLGSYGKDVSCLQNLLSQTGDFTYPEITEYFGPVTEAAVQLYQTRMGIVSSGTPGTTGFGVVGPLTRGSLAGSHTKISPATHTPVDTDEEEDTPVETITTTLKAPEAPSRFSIMGSGNQVRITWHVVENAVDYAIERKEGDAFETLATTDETSYVDSGISSSRSYTYRILARNAAGSTASEELVAHTTSGGGDGTAPTVSSSNASSTPENTTFAHALTANESVTWTIVGGADQAQFELSGSTLRWASDGTQDYETPADADTDNDYVVTVRATDEAGNTADQTITVSVTDVTESKTLNYHTYAEDLSDLTEYTFASQDIGTAGATRRVLVGVVGSQSARTVSSLTIGGVSATLAGRVQDGVSTAEVWIATVPTGTTADIVVTWSGLQDRMAIAVWSATGITDNTSLDSDGGNIGVIVNGTNVTLTSVNGGFVVGIGLHHNASTGHIVPRIMTQRSVSIMEANVRTLAADAAATTTSIVVGMDLGGGATGNGHSPYVVVSY